MEIQEKSRRKFKNNQTEKVGEKIIIRIAIEGTLASEIYPLEIIRQTNNQYCQFICDGDSENKSFYLDEEQAEELVEAFAKAFDWQIEKFVQKKIPIVE